MTWLRGLESHRTAFHSQRLTPSRRRLVSDVWCQLHQCPRRLGACLSPWLRLFFSLAPAPLPSAMIPPFPAVIKKQVRASRKARAHYNSRKTKDGYSPQLISPHSRQRHLIHLNFTFVSVNLSVTRLSQLYCFTTHALLAAV